MNKIIFTKLYVDGEEISRHDLGDTVRDLVEAQRLTLADNRGSTWPSGVPRTPASPPVWAGMRGQD